jgi:hypothetical protein
MGKSYLRDGWPKFVEDYDLKMGWSLIFARRVELPFSASVLSTPPVALAPTPPGRER